MYIKDVAKNKVRRFKDEKYYGKPLSGFGDVNAKLLPPKFCIGLDVVGE